MEPTRVFEGEEIKRLIKTWECNAPSRRTAIELATALLAEIDKPKIRDGAPDNAIIAQVHFYKAAKTYATPSAIPEVYTREPPKSRIDEIAEEYSGDTDTCHPMINGKRAVEVIKSAILRALEEKESVK